MLPSAAQETRSYTINPRRSAELRRQKTPAYDGSAAPAAPSVRPSVPPVIRMGQQPAPQPRQLPPPPAARFFAPYPHRSPQPPPLRGGPQSAAQLTPGPTDSAERTAVTRGYCGGRRSPGRPSHLRGPTPPRAERLGGRARRCGRRRWGKRSRGRRAGWGRGGAGRPSAPGCAAGSAGCQAAGTASARKGDVIIRRREREERGPSDGGLQGLSAAQGGARGG